MANMFIKIDGIKGSSSDDDHKEWIEVESMQGGMSLPFTGGRSGTGHASSGGGTVDPISFVKQFDAASVKLMEFCLNGTSIKEINIHVCRTINKKLKTYWEAKITEGVILNVNQNFNENMEPTEAFTINGATFEWKYTQMDKEGKVKGEPKTTWDATKQRE